MSLLPNVVGVLLWLGFTGLGVVGVGLAVAVADAWLDSRRKVPDADARRVMEGRWHAIRRYARWWAIGAAVWLVTGLALLVSVADHF